MELTISKANLLDGINIVARAVVTRTTTPILSCILFDTCDDGVRLTSNNLEYGIKTNLIPAEVSAPGSVALDARLLSDIIKKMPDGDIHISTDDKLNTTIKSGRTKLKINGDNPEEFPELPKIDQIKAFDIRQGDLQDMIQRTIFSTSRNTSKPVLSGQLVRVKDSRLCIVTCDLFRISHRYIDMESTDDVEFIVPASAMGEVARLISKSDEHEAAVYCTDKHVLFETDTCTIVSQLLEGQYIEYEKALSIAVKTTTKVNNEDFLHALERVCLVAEADRQLPVKLEITNDTIELSGSTEKGNAQDEITAISTGDKLTVSFNPRLLMEALKAIEDIEVEIQFGGSKSPCKIRPIEQGTYEYLILPLRQQ